MDNRSKLLSDALADAYRRGDNEAMDEVLAAIDEMAKDRDEKSARLKAMDIPELKRLTDGGDDDACYYYCSKRIHEDTLEPNDVWRMYDGAKRMNYDCARLCSYIFGIKNGGYESRTKELYSIAVMEQSNDKAAYKKLAKAYKREFNRIDAADKDILSVLLATPLANAMANHYTGCVVDVVSCDLFDRFNVCKYKRAFKVGVTFYGKGLVPDATGQLYTYYCRKKDKRDDIDRLCAVLTEFFESTAEKSGITRAECVVDNNPPRLIYGGGEKIVRERPKVELQREGDFEINVSVTDKEAIKQAYASVCPYCGGAVENGVCTACKRAVTNVSTAGGKTRVTASGASINIEKSAKGLTELICTRCGAPVERDASGTTGLCPACGTTYLIDNDALKNEQNGLDLKSIKAGMPKDAILPEVKFMRAKVAGDAISMVIPSDFIPMPDEIVRIKYPANAPEHMYSTPDWRINLGLRAGPPLNDDGVAEFGTQMLALLKKLQTRAKFDKPQIIDGDHLIYFFDFISPAGTYEFYNAMFVFSCDGKQYTGSWNCYAEDRWFWAPVFKLAVQTMKF